MYERWTSRLTGGCLPGARSSVEASRGEVAAIGCEYGVADVLGMANARRANGPVRRVHDADGMQTNSRHGRPENRRRGTRIELGRLVMVAALRLPREFGRRERRPAVWMGKSPESSFGHFSPDPGRREAS